MSAQPQPPQFEFVSVRRVPPMCGAFEASLRCERLTPPRSTWRAFAGGRLEVTNHTAFDLVRVAYGLESLNSQYLAGGPGWLKSERYDVIALTGADGQSGIEKNLTARIRLMLRGLLDDRFKLRVHIAPKKADVFVLSRPDSGALGPALKRSRGDCLEPPVTWDLPDCTTYVNGRIQATNISITDLTQLLSRIVRAPVVDETRIEGRFDVSLDLRAQAFTGNAATAASVVRQELHLDLQRAKRMVDHVEIKSAERPLDD